MDAARPGNVWIVSFAGDVPTDLSWL